MESTSFFLWNIAVYSKLFVLHVIHLFLFFFNSLDLIIFNQKMQLEFPFRAYFNIHLYSAKERNSYAFENRPKFVIIHSYSP